MADTVIPSLTGGITEYFKPGATITFTAAEAITGGNLVEGNGTSWQVAQGNADSVVFHGVALHDAAQDAKVSVAFEGVWPLVASAAINAGDFVKAAAAGKVAPIAADGDPRLIVGVALADIAQDAAGPIRLGV